MFEILPWFILFLPLAACAAITLRARRLPEVSANLSIAAVVIGFLLSVVLFLRYHNAPVAVERSVIWMSVGELQVEFGWRLDRLSLLMLLVVTGVGSLIHIYSRGYMKGDPGYARYFSFLSLFTFSMLGIVLANNFLQMFIFWELVGLSSYLLIGFWYSRDAAADAARKAFLTNRLGDFGFIVGIILIWAAVAPKTLNFGALAAQFSGNPGLLGSYSSVAGLLIFCGAMGKSAQFPLHVWLPDAMEGPTPVSALIHAATMVAAGVYMLCRVFFLYSALPAWPESWTWLEGVTALGVIGWLGALTALLAALIAIQQNDIKRILAYSTLSQLGYMIMAVGVSAPDAAMYHLTTHAFFKALLFLCAGSVIYALHHEQNIWNMGGLKERLPVTFWTFLLGTLALCGVPPLSGFFSKDAILAAAYHDHTGLFLLGLFVAILTPFYMFRLLYVAFLNPARSDAARHAVESPSVMTWPLILLGIPTVLAGFWGIGHMVRVHYGAPVEAHQVGWVAEFFAPLAHAPLAVVMGIGAVMVGITLAWRFYRGATLDPLPAGLGPLARAMRNRFYFDELYEFLITITVKAPARLIDALDRFLVGGLVVKGLAGVTEIAGRALRLLQTGNLQTYAFLFALGVAVVLYLFLGH